jgi:hypothetical protein
VPKTPISFTMSDTMLVVAKTIKTLSDKVGTVTVFMGGPPGSGKTTACNMFKKMCNDMGMTGVIVEQSPNCNKTYIDLSRSLEQAYRTKKTPAEIKIDNEISATSVELTKLTNKLKNINADTEKYEELSQTQIDLNTKLVALKNSRVELKASLTGKPEYVNDFILLDRTQVAESHRNTITKIYSELFNKELLASNCIGVNMITSLETCIARIPKNRNYEHCVKFTTTLFEQFEHMTMDQGYAYVFDIDGVTPNTTELKTVKPTTKLTKPKLARANTSAGSGGGGNAWATKPNVPAEKTETTETTETIEENTDPFESSDHAPDESPNTEEVMMMGFVLGLSVKERTELLRTLENLKKNRILGEDALRHPVKYCNAISCRRTTKALTINSFKNVPMPGTKVPVTFDAYVCDNNLGCLTARLNDTVNFVSGRTFMPIDLALGNNGNASKMLDTKSGTRYPIDPITIEMTVGIQIRNPDHTISTVYDSRVLGPNMFKLLSQ